MSNMVIAQFYEWFSWHTRGVIAFMFLGAAALMILLGLTFALVRPRGIGFFVLLGSGLLTVVNTWLWYALPYMDSHHGAILAIIVIFNITIAIGTRTAADSPTARECGISKPLEVISFGFKLYAAWFIALSAFLYVTAIAPYVQLLLPPCILMGTTAILIGTVYALIKRIKADPPPRAIDLP